jgi:CheY-like chemotaxis protein
MEKQKLSKVDISKVRLLIVEDNPRYLQRLQRNLSDLGYNRITAATTAIEACTFLELPNFYDIIVADMRLGSNIGGGFTVLEEINKRNIASAVIILTANDAVLDCRRAFQEGAWDYITKAGEGDSIKILDDSIRRAVTYYNEWGKRADERWIQDNMSKLSEEYSGQTIAVMNSRVLIFAENEESVRQQLVDSGLPVYLPIIRAIGCTTLSMIRQGESDRVEFKSTWKWELQPNPKSIDIRSTSLKAICAFLNSEGGTLLIGIGDNSEVLGLENDYAMLKRPTRDGLEQDIINLINERISCKAALARLIKVRFDRILDKDVCFISVCKAPEPAFVKDQNKVTHFYIRFGNSSKPLDIEATYQYIRTHWPLKQAQ